MAKRAISQAYLNAQRSVQRIASEEKPPPSADDHVTAEGQRHVERGGKFRAARGKNQSVK